MKNLNYEKSFFFLKKLQKEQNERLRRQEHGSRDKEPNLFGVSTALINFFLLEQLKIFCAYLSYKVMMHGDVIKYKETDFKLMSAIFELLESQQDWHPIIQIYWKIYHLFKNLESDKGASQKAFNDFVILEKLISESEKHITDIERIEIYSNLTNYVAYQITTYTNEAFIPKSIHYNLEIIYLEQATKKDFIVNVGVYKNIVSLILRLENWEKPILLKYFDKTNVDNCFNWADTFVEKYKAFLPPDKNVYYAYCKSLILFREHKILEAFEIIKNIKRVREMFLSLDMKVLRLQLILDLEIEDNIELNQEDIFVNQEIEQYRTLLRHDKNQNQKLTEYHKEYYWTFLHIYRKFYVFFNKYGWVKPSTDLQHTQKLKTLEDEIRQIPYSYSKWLLKKLHQIT